jgi:hypothetical protein
VPSIILTSTDAQPVIFSGAETVASEVFVNLFSGTSISQSLGYKKENLPSGSVYVALERIHSSLAQSLLLEEKG